MSNGESQLGWAQAFGSEPMTPLDMAVKALEEILNTVDDGELCQAIAEEALRGIRREMALHIEYREVGGRRV